MKFIHVAVVVVALGFSAGLLAQSTLSPEAQLKAAMNREVVARDLPGAIDQYKQIAATFASNHPVASKALLQLGRIYDRMGRPEAGSTYQRIVTEYPDTGATYATARARLNAIQQANSGPFKWRELDGLVEEEQAVSPSPNGKFIAYPHAKPSETASLGLNLRDLASGRERVLIDVKPGERVLQAYWSPDSQRIATAVRKDNHFDLRVVSIAGGDVRILERSELANSMFAWSPDSKCLAYVVKPSREDDTWEHHVIAIGNPGPSVVVDTLHESAQAATWSPDSRRVGYVAAGTGADTIRMKTLGTDSTQSISVPKSMPTSRVTLKSWLATGELWYVQSVSGGSDSYLVSASGGASRKICEGRESSGGDGCQDLSPDGVLQVTRKNASGGGRVILRNVKDEAERPLTPEAVKEVPALGGFSPDGRLFGFTSNRDGSSGFYVVPVDSIPVSAPVKVIQLDSDSSAVTGRWTPTGLVVNISNNQTNQYRVDLDPRTGKPTGAPVRLTEDSPVNRGHEISPDGRRIAYISRGRQTGIAVMDAHGVGERVIKAVPADMLARMTIMGWLSDSDLLIADAQLGTGAMRTASKHLMRLNTATGEIREAGAAVNASSVWGIGGGQVIYSGGSGMFMTRAVTGGLVKSMKVENWWDYAAAGSFLAFSTGDESGGRNKPVPGDIRVRSLETGAERIVAKFADTKDGDHHPLDVSLDGKYLLYQDPSRTIRMANVETGESWDVVKNPPAGVEFGYAAGKLSPDGSYLVLEGFISKTTWRAYEGVTYDAIKKLIGAKK